MAVAATRLDQSFEHCLACFGEELMLKRRFSARGKRGAIGITSRRNRLTDTA